MNVIQNNLIQELQWPKRLIEGCGVDARWEQNKLLLCSPRRSHINSEVYYKDIVIVTMYRL